MDGKKIEEIEINELIEMAQEETDSDEFKAEVARRYRLGVGVAVDPLEAEYWEKQINRKCDTQERWPAAEQMKNSSIEAPFDEDAMMKKYQSMSEQELYRAYRMENLWGQYFFIVKYMEKEQPGDVCHELNKLEKLITEKLDDPTEQKSMICLLAHVKAEKGKTYARGLGVPVNIRQACTCYEEAALELGDERQLPYLLDLYEKRADAEKNSALIGIARRLEDGTDYQKLQAARAYQIASQPVFAIPLLHEIVAQSNASWRYRYEAILSLHDLGKLSLGVIRQSGNCGDAVYLLAAAKIYLDQNQLDEAERLLQQLGQTSPEMKEYIVPYMREGHRKRYRLEEEQKRQEEARLQQERLRREEEQRQKERAAKAEKEAAKQAAEQEKNRHQNKIKSILKEHPILEIAAILFAIAIFRQVLSIPGCVARELRMETVDVFEDVELHFVGASPYARVEVFNNSGNPYLQTLDFVVDPAKDVENGDKVKVTAKFSKQEAKNAGYRIKDKEKNFKVEGLGKYILEPKNLKSEIFAELKSEAQDAVKAYLSDLNDSNYRFADIPIAYTKSTTKIGEPVLKHSYLLTEKSFGNHELVNSLVMIWETEFYREDTFDVLYDGTLSMCVMFDNLIIENDGTFKLRNEPRTSNIYQSEDALFQHILVPLKDNYQIKELKNK